MDEYDELFEIEDQFEEQFADELEVLAQLEEETSQPAQCLKRVQGDDISDIQHLLDNQSSTPKAKRQKQDTGVVKRLFNASQTQQRNVPSQDDNITPPSSPEHYEPSNTFRSTPAVLDMSGLAEIPETPRQPVTSPPPSRFVLKRPPLEGDFISVTDSSGNRVYLRQKGEADKKIVNSPNRISPNCHGALGLLALPVRVLREQEAERHHQQVVESQRLTELLVSSVNDEFTDSGNTEDQENEDPQDAEGQTSQLWVERFSPRHYTELLSDDVNVAISFCVWSSLLRIQGLMLQFALSFQFTNRCLLKWLKLWDNVVFGRERKSRPVRSDRQSANQNPFKVSQGSQNPHRFKSKMEMTEEILEAELDQYKRPKYRVALLSGPPGLGKTTLAHVIAKHAGYNVVEINASDDRSAEVFQKRIDAATQMRSVLGANERPNCLIIDEIDGAPAAAINILLSVLNRKDTHGGDAATEKAKKKKKESVLLRPIICICNDLYVPALRPLRQQAFLLVFPQTQPSRLSQRLAEISTLQGLKADTGALMCLCEKTDNDIRSCINTLQFLHGRGLKQLDSRIIQSISVGQKDQNKGLFCLWQEIFQLPRTKR
ncbi:hypothetical protein CCH79_00018449 [Gambusia affinis]|uniref:AAA+ ATPase domain-containing protein n=1 Tax=Gambusia affinis TaxID=33528 RepID=A0A315VGB8_GAMAF|nr:hypothetical protein CCH79_00018449 [Gambusia affinis]